MRLKTGARSSELECYRQRAEFFALPPATQAPYQVRQSRGTTDVARENNKSQTWIGGFRSKPESGNARSDLPENSGSFGFQAFGQNIV